MTTTTTTTTIYDLLGAALVAAHQDLGDYLRHYQRCRYLLARANRTGDTGTRSYALALLNRSRARVNRQRQRIDALLDTLISRRIDPRLALVI